MESLVWLDKFPSSQIIESRRESCFVCTEALRSSSSHLSVRLSTLRTEEMKTGGRRVTFNEVPSQWTGWENPFLDGSELRAEAEEILSLWRQERQGGTPHHQYQASPGETRDQDQPQEPPVTVAHIKQRENKQEKSSKLYRKFIKWKVKLTQNFIKVR